MKVYAAASSPGPGKRRWRGFAAAVLALVFLSMLVPLAFLLGLHNRRFPSAYLADDKSPQETGFQNYERVDRGLEQNLSKGDQRIDNLVDRLVPTIPKISKDVPVNMPRQPSQDLFKEINNKSSIVEAQFTSGPKDATSHSRPKNITSSSKGPSTEQVIALKAPLSSDTRDSGRVGKGNHVRGSASEETEKPCQLEFGSYCLWSIAHREVFEDSTVQRLKDQLFVARAYYPSIAKLQGQEKLAREMKQNIQEHERMLSDAISDDDLPPLVGKKIQKMDQTIARAKSCPVECGNVEKKFRQLLDLTEDEAHFHMKQSAFLYQLGVQTMPKSLHCLSMRLTVEYFKSPALNTGQSHAHKIDSSSFQHFVILSRNILALSVTINSTVMNSKESENMVFHLLTDRQNYYAMKHWFARNAYKEATIHVMNVDDLKLNYSYDLGLSQLSPSEEFRIFIRNTAQTVQTRTDYISVFGHSHFLLPEIFKNLKRVVVLDDDVVVQRDLSYLWNLDLGGKVNGAVEFCGVRMGQLKTYLGSSNFDGNSCVWMSGLNIIDLEKWREYDITGIYRQLLPKLYRKTQKSWRAAALPASLLAFKDRIYAIDDTLVQSGLGQNYGVSADAMEAAAVLHYNGNMKPWLELGIAKYKPYWKKFLKRGEQFMDECNVNP